MNFGFQGLQNRTSSPQNTNPNPGFPLLIGRVSDIILDDSHKDFNKEGTIGEGGWSSLGNIYFIDLNTNGPSDSKPKIAKPLSPSIKNPPLINEMVYIFALPDRSSQQNSLSVQYYYSNIISIWNHPLHNANPFFLDSTNSSKKSYSSILSSNNPGVVKDKSSKVNLGIDWIENKKTNPLYQYLGDNIIEGRFNNSIRLGSTIKKSTNNWSTSGDEGDPIMIIRNTLNNNQLDSWIPYNEDINKDSSSIYITSTQKIPLNINLENYKNIIEQTTSIPEFNKSQILLVSNRLVFHSNNDDILLFSQKSMSLNALKSLGLSGENIILNSSSKVLLGNKQATESVLLGDKTLKSLETLLKSLNTLCISLEGASDWPGGQPAPATSIRYAASSTKSIVNQLIKDLDNLKSKVVKTI